jgi:hypothetical protein
MAASLAAPDPYVRLSRPICDIDPLEIPQRSSPLCAIRFV